MQGDREKALEAGMDDYVPKPVKPEELEAVLKRWIQEQEESSKPPATTLATMVDADSTAAASDRAEAPLDESVLAGLRELQEEDEPDILKELIELFLEEVPPQLAALRGAIEGGEASSVERIAHTLKGSSGNLGAVRMAAVCAELEKVGGSGELTRAAELLERLEVEFESACQALNAEVPR